MISAIAGAFEKTFSPLVKSAKVRSYFHSDAESPRYSILVAENKDGSRLVFGFIDNPF
jgi:hypothetical protein